MKSKQKSKSILKPLLLLTLLFSCNMAKGQLASWVMRPAYDSIHIAKGAPVVLSDSAGFTTIWSVNAKRLAKTPDSLCSFKEKLAVTIKNNTDTLTGFYNVDGKFTHIDGYCAAYSYPYFSSGYLLADKDGRKVLIGTDGKEDPFSAYFTMYPFNNGMACCSNFKDEEKLEKPYFYYITEDKTPVTLTYDKKEIDNEDVKFLSTLNDEGIGLAIIKRRVFFFNKSDSTLKPVYADETAEKKKQIQVDGHREEYLRVSNDTTFITGRGAKNEIVCFALDKQMRLVSVKYPKSEREFKHVTPPEHGIAAYYTAEKSADGLYSLHRDGKTVLPPQFEGVGLLIDRFAVVRTHGKWGTLAINDSLDYRLSMNKGNDIAFRHQKFETMVRLDLPPSIKADNCRFEISGESGCTIDKTSVWTRNTESGNYVQYNCVLSIPDSLPDHLTEINYPVRMVCDGVIYPEKTLTVRAWHYKYVTVDLIRDETKFNMGNLEFTIDISAEKVAGENDYPLTVEVMEDSTVHAELEKLSEMRYKCRLYSLEEGMNKITIKVSESGCPPSLFPFEINYTKPKGNASRKGDTKGQVEISAKAANTAVNTPYQPQPPVSDSIAVDTVAVDSIAAPAQ